MSEQDACMHTHTHTHRHIVDWVSFHCTQAHGKSRKKEKTFRNNMPYRTTPRKNKRQLCYQTCITFCPGSTVKVMSLRTRSRSDRYRKESFSTLTCPFWGQASGGRWPFLSHEAWGWSDVHSSSKPGGTHTFLSSHTFTVHHCALQALIPSHFGPLTLLIHHYL